VFTCLVLTIPYFFIRRKKGLIFIILFLVNFMLYGNVVYYRAYSTMMPWQSLLLFDNLTGLDASIWFFSRWTDLLFFIPAGLLTGLCFSMIRKQIVVAGARTRAFFVIVILLGVVGMERAGISL
jgi:ATP/ADP translocase